MELVERYARTWPREVFDFVVSEPGQRVRYLAKELEILRQPGVYILYREDIPYYVGKASNWLWHRLYIHARRPGGRYNNHWNYFSVFVIHDKAQRDAVESILIAAFPTANGARPRMTREPLPPEALDLWRQKRDIVRSPTRVKYSAEDLEAGHDDL